MTIMGGLIILIVTLLTVNLAGTAVSDTETIQRFQEYLRINTTSNSDLTPAVEFWRRLAALADVPLRVYNMTEGYPIVVMKWTGTNCSAPGIMLNSHMDVVPANEDDGWTYPPFSATLTDDGVIYGRGTQDMKSVSMQYYEALRQLKEDGVELKRNVYMTLMPDEEIGAKNGMQPFLRSKEFAALNIGFSMDEGSSYQLPVVPLFYQDKVVWQIQVDCYGEATHGSTFSETNSTATGKCRNVVDRLFEFREEQYELSKLAPLQNAGNYTSLNLNRINAGTANNIVPPRVTLVFDIRLDISINEEQFEAQIRQWIADAGEDIQLTFISKNPQSPATVVSPNNPYFVAIQNATREVGLQILPIIPPGSTDARHVRNAGIPAFGFSPMPNTTMLLHAVNERINVTVFLQGIEVYKHIINKLANIPIAETLSDSRGYLVRTTK